MTKTGVVQSTTHGKNSVTMNRDKSQKRQYVRRKELTFNKFLNDLPKMMYGFGDVPEPFEQSKELLNHMAEEYIKDFVTEAIAGNPDKKLTASALKFRIRNPQKRKRIDELLLMNEELKDAKKLDVDQ